MGFVKNRIKKYINNIISEVMDEKYNNGDFCQHDWELIFDLTVNSQKAINPVNYIKIYRCKKCGLEKRYEAEKQ